MKSTTLIAVEKALEAARTYFTYPLGEHPMLLEQIDAALAALSAPIEKGTGEQLSDDEVQALADLSVPQLRALIAAPENQPVITDQRILEIADQCGLGVLDKGKLTVHLADGTDIAHVAVNFVRALLAQQAKSDSGHEAALQELADQAQELDMGYGPNACSKCGKSNQPPIAPLDGMQLVPIEPTREMFEAARCEFDRNFSDEYLISGYRAMLAAAPSVLADQNQHVHLDKPVFDEPPIAEKKA